MGLACADTNAPFSGRVFGCCVVPHSSVTQTGTRLGSVRADQNELSSTRLKLSTAVRSSTILLLCPIVAPHLYPHRVLSVFPPSPFVLLRLSPCFSAVSVSVSTSLCLQPSFRHPIFSDVKYACKALDFLPMVHAGTHTTTSISHHYCNFFIPHSSHVHVWSSCSFPLSSEHHFGVKSLRCSPW